MKVICPTDFSTISTEATNVAAALACKRKVPLQLIYCAANQIVGADIPVICAEDRVAPEQLEQESRRLASSGAEVTSSIVTGSESLQIASAAQDDAEIIVMGSTGKGGADRWLLGSVSERVSESAPVPTLVVRSAEPLLGWLRNACPLRVLCAVDFSTSADAALAAAKHLANLGPVEYEVAYISRTDPLGPASLPEEQTSEREQSMQRDVWERAQQLLGCAEVKVHFQETSDNPAFAFVRLADERKVDLVVVGTHQKQGMKRLVSPSFSREVLKHAAANVLCVPLSSYKPEFRLPQVERVLVATDFSTESEHVIQHGCSLLPQGGSLRLLHVCEAPRSGIDPFVAAKVYFDQSLDRSKAAAEAEERLYTIAPRQMATAGVNMSVRALQSNDVASAICESADEYGADIICMGSGKHGAISKALLGSMVGQVVAKSHRPILVVPPEVR